MKNKILISLGIIFVVLFAIIFSFQRLGILKSNFDVKSLGDGKGILVGERRPQQYKESDPSKWTTETRKRVEEYEADVRAIDEAHKYRMAAYQFEESGDLSKAADMYLKAYEIGKGSRHVSGFNLAQIYEKLGRYDEGVAILDQMINNHETNENGVREAREMRARLIAADNGTGSDGEAQTGARHRGGGQASRGIE